VLIVVGVVFALCGFKVFKPVLTLICSLGSGYVALTLVAHQTTAVIAAATIGAAVLSGGLLLFFFSVIALPLLGILDGVLLCAVLMHSLGGWAAMAGVSSWAPIVTFCGSGVLFGAPSMCCPQKHTLTLYTAVVGGISFAIGLSQFTKTNIGMKEVMQGRWDGETCDTTCLYTTVGGAALMLLGVVAQGIMGGCRNKSKYEGVHNQVIEVHNPAASDDSPLIDAHAYDTPLAARIRQKYSRNLPSSSQPAGGSRNAVN